MLTQTAKNTNVLVLLNTLYTSGFATMSPTVPFLNSRTMHSLYAISFIVYSSVVVIDWVHTYNVLKGSVTSFQLEHWFVIYMVGVCVIGSMLIMLLLVLCVENAFAQRIYVSPYRAGLTIVLEAFVEWLQSFNNFRVAFLFAIFHDGALTLANFFLIPACRCAGAQQQQWSLILSTISICFSLIWRLVLLYFAYRRMVCPKKKVLSNCPSRSQSFLEHIDQQISLSGDRMWDFDETWPIRRSVAIVYGEYPIKTQTTIYYTSNSTVNPILSCLENTCCFFFIWILHKLGSLIKRLLCIILSTVMYALCCFVCCLPCCLQYTCGRQSFARRHKCYKSFVRYFTILFHYTMMIFSTITTILFLGLNLTLLFSVHGIGFNNVPPEIYKVCYRMDRNYRFIQPYVMPYDHDLKIQNNVELACKSIWEDPRLRHRLHTGPWQTRLNLNVNETLAIATQFVSVYDKTTHPYHIIYYDYALLNHENRKTGCRKRRATNWRFLSKLNQLHSPYFLACRNDIRLVETSIIRC